MILGKGPLRLGAVSALFALLLSIGLSTTGVAHAQGTPGPRFFGYAESGDSVEAFIDDVSCGDAVTAASDGLWMLDVDGTAACSPAEGDTVSFTLNGADTNETENWTAGGTSADATAGTTLTLAEAEEAAAEEEAAPAPADTGNAGLLSEQGTSPWMALSLGAFVLALAAGARTATGRVR